MKERKQEEGPFVGVEWEISEPIMTHLSSKVKFEVGVEVEVEVGVGVRWSGDCNLHLWGRHSLDGEH